MPEEEYSQIFTNYLIIDTCVLLHFSDLIARLLSSIRTKQLSFKIVIPVVVRKELEKQAVSSSDIVDTYLSWYKDPNFIRAIKLLRQQATEVLQFFDACIREDIVSFAYQGNEETAHFHAMNNDDLILDCLMYYNQQFSGRATLLSNDTELCSKAELLHLKSIHRSEHAEWQTLLRACQVDDLPLELLPKVTITKEKEYNQQRFHYDRDEIIVRRSQYRSTLIQMETIYVDDLDYLELPRGVRRWVDRPLLSSKLVFQQDDSV